MARPCSFDRAAVLDATVDQFWTTGYTATSTDDLCACADLSRSSLYNSFGGKRDVYLASLQRYIDERVADRERTLQRPESGRDLLRATLRKVIGIQYADPSHRVCFGIHACVELGTSDPQIGKVLADNATAFDRTIEQILTRGIDDGSIAPADAHALARVIHAALDGLQVRARITGSRKHIEADIDTLMRLIP